MAGVEFSITGLDEFREKLKAVTDDTRFKGGRAALRKAAQVVRDRAREGATRLNDSATPEDIAQNIVERWNGRRFKKTGDLAFRVGVLGGARQYADTSENRRAGRVGESYEVGGDKGNPGGDTYYWRFLEFGTEKTPARPFMRPAMESSAGEVADTFVREYGKAIDRAIKRARKKGAKA